MPLFLLRYWKSIGLAILVAGLLSYGLRNDHLRAGYKERLDTIRIAFKDMGETVRGYDDLVPVANKVGAERARYRRERDAAQGVVDVQSASIRQLGQESADAARQAQQLRQQIAAVTQQRDAWIARARAASTRTERLSAEQELAQCEAVLDRLYAAGF